LALTLYKVTYYITDAAKTGKAYSLSDNWNVWVCLLCL